MPIPEEDHQEFVGIELLKSAHKSQIENFRLWARAGDWMAFHDNHYDWWAFPITAPSSHGYKYSLSKSSIERLKGDVEFMKELSGGAQLLLTSWGWDFKTNQPIVNSSAGQSWANWPIRLYKCWKSMRLFNCLAEEKACFEYAKWLNNHGHSFEYLGRNLFDKFVTGQPSQANRTPE
jgi:hypothetical protein